MALGNVTPRPSRGWQGGSSSGLELTAHPHFNQRAEGVGEIGPPSPPNLCPQPPISPSGPSKSHECSQGGRRGVPGWGQGTLEKIVKKFYSEASIQGAAGCRNPVGPNSSTSPSPPPGRGWEAACGREGRSLEAPRSRGHLARSAAGRTGPARGRCSRSGARGPRCLFSRTLERDCSFFFKTKQDFSPIQVYLFKASANTKVLVMYIDLSGNLIPLYLKSPAGDSCREGCGGGADSPAPRAQRRTLEFLLNFIPGEKRSASLGLFEWEGRTRKASPRSGDWEAASSEVSARDLGGGGCGGI